MSESMIGQIFVAAVVGGLIGYALFGLLYVTLWILNGCKRLE